MSADEADGPGRLARARLAQGVRRPGPHPPSSSSSSPTRSRRAGFPLPFLTLNTVGPTLRQFGTDEQKDVFLPRHPRRRAPLRHRLLGARGRHRPRLPAHHGHPRRRRVGDQRPEDVDEPGRPFRLHLAGGTHRPEPRSIAACRCSSSRRPPRATHDQQIRTVGGVTHQRHVLRRRPGSGRALIGGENNGWR